MMLCLKHVLYMCFRGDTHKNDVVLFCQKKAHQCREDVAMIDRQSADLVWKFLELLIKQNGVSQSDWGESIRLG